MPHVVGEIGIVVYPGVQSAAVHGLTDLFRLTNQRAIEREHIEREHNGAPSLRITHWQAEHPENAQYLCVYDSAPFGMPEPQVLLIPPTLLKAPSPEVPSGVVSWLRQRHSMGIKLISVCSGAFIIAETGLANGRSIATHSVCAGPLASRYPQILIDVNQRVIDHGDILTAGGFLSWVDVGLVLVERFMGSAIKADTARFLFADSDTVELGFKGFTPNLAHGDAAVLKAQEWVHLRDGREASVAAMADAAGLERRTFLRRFVKAAGTTPIQYCRAVRIARTCELLGGSDMPQKMIAELSGYQDVASFARAFQKATGMAPGAYRKKYNHITPAEVYVGRSLVSCGQDQPEF
jgi:transcriptional regulator GlxA family with amidase domain